MENSNQRQTFYYYYLVELKEGLTLTAEQHTNT